MTATAIFFLLFAPAVLTGPAAGVASFTFYVSGTSVGETSPGTTKDYTLNLTNLNSTSAISFNLSISASPVGWTTQLSQSALTVPASGTRQVTLSVKPPSSALADNVGQYVNVTATPDDNTTAQTVSTTTRVTEVLGVSLTVIPTAGTSGDPGQNITWNAYLKNTGNSAQTYTVTVNNTSYTTTNLTSNLVTVSAGDTRGVLVTINISSSAQVGTLYSAISATNNANSSIKDSVTFSASVNAKRAVSLAGLTPDDLTGSAEPESSITFRNILVENKGNVADSYTLQGTANASRHGDWVSFQTSTISLSAFTQRYINVTVNVPDGVTTMVEYTVEFRIISDNSTSVIAFLNLTVSVVAKHDLKMVYESLVAKQSGDPGATVSFPINVSNPGAYDQRVDINYSGPNAAWASISASPFTLSPGAFKIVYANFSIPGSQSPTTFDFQVLGSINWTSPYRNRTVDLTLEVRQIYDVQVSTTASAASGLPGASVVFTVTVKNTGTGPDNFTLTASNTTQAGVVTLSNSSIFLAGGASMNVTLTVAITSAPLPAAGVYYYALTARSSGNVSENSSVNLALTVRQVYALSASVSPSYQTSDPGVVASYTVSITNDGNGADTVTLQRAGVNQSWLGFPTGSGNIASGGRLNLTVQVTTPSWAAPGDTVLTVRVVSSGDANVSTSPTFTISINARFGVSLTAGASDIPDAHRNSTYTVSFTLRNSGNQADTYTISITGADAGWASPAAASYALNPNANQTFLVTVTTPAAPSNGPHGFTVVASSLGSSGLTASGSFTVTINDVLKPELRLPQSSFFALPNETKSITFTVKNNGTIADTIFVYAVAHFPAEKYLNLTLPLLPGQSVNRTFVIQADNPYSDTYLVEFTATSTTDSSFEARATASIVMDVRRSVDLTADLETVTGGPGDVFTFNLTINNTGNITDTYTVAPPTLPGSGWFSSLSSSSFTLDSFEMATFTLTLTAPSPLDAGTYLTGVTVTSTTVGSASRDILTLQVGVTYGVSLTGTGQGTQLLPGASHTFTAIVENTGSAAGDFRLSISGQVATWASVDQPVVSLASGQTATVQVTVAVPASEHEGVRTFALTAASVADATRTSTLGYTVNVDQRFGFVVSGPLGPVSTLPSQAAVFQLTLTNTGNGNENYSFVANPPAYTTFSPLIVQLDALQTANISVMYTPPPGAAASTYPLKVTVYGSNGAFEDVYLNATVLQVYSIAARGVPTDNVTVVAAPGATLSVSFEVSNRGNGMDTIAWSLSGAAAAWANATAGSVTLAAGTPALITISFDVPDAPLPAAGAMPFTFHAQSTAGGSATARTANGTLLVGDAPSLQFSLDNTGTNTSYTRNVDRASPGSVNFTVWVFNLGNRVETVTLTRTAPTGWSVTINGSSSAVLTLAPGESGTALVRIASFPASATDGQVVLTARVGDGKVPELTITYGIHFERGIPRFLADSAVISSTNVAARSSITVTFDVVNDGDGTATAIAVDLRVDGTRVVTSDTIAQIPPHGRTTVSLTWVTSDSDAGASHSVSVGVAGQNPVPVGDVTVTGGSRSFTTMLLTDRNMWTAAGLGLAIGVALGFVMFYRRRKPAPEAAGAPLAMAAMGPPPGPEAALAGLEALEAEGAGAAPMAPPMAAPGGVDHKVVCPECGTEQWIRGAEGECKTCGVVIEVAEDAGPEPPSSV